MNYHINVIVIKNHQFLAFNSSYFAFRDSSTVLDDFGNWKNERGNYSKTKELFHCCDDFYKCFGSSSFKFRNKKNSRRLSILKRKITTKMFWSRPSILKFKMSGKTTIICFCIMSITDIIELMNKKLKNKSCIIMKILKLHFGDHKN